jgi:hypothetical protein
MENMMKDLGECGNIIFLAVQEDLEQKVFSYGNLYLQKLDLM